MSIATSVGALLFFHCATHADPVFSELATKVESPAIDAELAVMSVEEKVGQLLVLGLNGYENDATNAKKIHDIKPGGVILFSRNIRSARQVTDFLYDLQADSKKAGALPLFTAVDQEGGSVTRLKTWPPLPSEAAIGRANDTNLAFKIAFFTGQVMRTLGFNMNLAPVLDLTNPTHRSFIGSRGFGKNPDSVIKFGRAVVAGYSSADIVTISKHFPGHGAANGDSHHGLPSIEKPLEELAANDLRPFITLAQQQTVPGLMVAHLALPDIEPSGLAATFSKNLLTDYLRGTLKFAGLVMTDDLEMLGAKNFTTAEGRAIAAVNAGADLILVAWNPESQRRAFAGLVAAVKDGRIPLGRLNRSVTRILAAKEKFHVRFAEKRTSDAELRTFLPHRELMRAIDSIVTKNLLLSLKNSSTESLVSSHWTLFSSDNAFTKTLVLALGAAHVLSRKIPGDLDFFEQTLDQLPEHERALFFATHKNDFKILNQLSAASRHRLVVVTSEMPYSITSPTAYQAVIYSFTRHPGLGGLLGELLTHRVRRIPATTGLHDQSYLKKDTKSLL